MNEYVPEFAVYTRNVFALFVSTLNTPPPYKDPELRGVTVTILLEFRPETVVDAELLDPVHERIPACALLKTAFPAKDDEFVPNVVVPPA